MVHRIGVVGTGTIAVNRHLPAYLRSDVVDLVGVYDRTPKTLDKVEAEYGVNTYENVESLYGDVQTIVVCTPPWTHRDIAVEAFEGDCNVFTEKPMAMSTAEANEMIAAAAAHDKRLAVVHNNLWKRSVVEAAEKVESGELGGVRRTYAVQLREMDDWDRHSEEWFDELPGGLFWDEAPHMMYLTRQFTGDADIVEANTDIQ